LRKRKSLSKLQRKSDLIIVTYNLSQLIMVDSTSPEELKNQGNDALKAGDAAKAVLLYSASLGKHLLIFQFVRPRTN
jgi:hypothetical protein